MVRCAPQEMGLPLNAPSRIKMVAKAIARGHYDKTRLGSGGDARKQFAVDWWHYFIHEARMAIDADTSWRLYANKRSPRFDDEF